MVFIPITDQKQYGISYNKTFTLANASKSFAQFYRLNVPNTNIYTDTQKVYSRRHSNLWVNFYQENGYINKGIDYEIPNSVYTQHQELPSKAVVIDVQREFIVTGIVSGSIALSYSSSSVDITLNDDGNGNLIDTTLKNTNLETFVNTNKFQEFYFDFNSDYHYSASCLVDKSYNLTKTYLTKFVTTESYNGIGFNCSSGSVVDVVYTKPLNDFTVFARIKPNVTQTPDTGSTSYFIKRKNGFYIGYNSSSNKFEYSFLNSVYTSSTSVNTSSYNNVWLRRRNNGLEFYVDGVLDSYQTQSLVNQYRSNNEYIKIGNDFSGIIDEVRLYSSSLDNHYITQLNTLSDNDYYVGNIFYEYGVIAITSQRDRHQCINTSSFSLTGYGNKRVNEFQLMCNIPKGKLQYTNNPSLCISGSNTLNPAIVNSPGFYPYITSIGLYNDHNELLATAKLSKPLQKIDSIDYNLLIKFDY